MIVEITKDQKKIGIRVGYSLPVAAAERYRKIKADAFQASLAALASNQSPQASTAILSGLEEFLKSQLPTDEEVTRWLRTWDGKCFALIHGSNNLIPDLSTAAAVLDQISEAEFEAFEDAMTAILKGSKAADLEKRERELAIRTEEWQLKLSEEGFRRLTEPQPEESPEEWPESSPIEETAPETTAAPHPDTVAASTTSAPPTIAV